MALQLVIKQSSDYPNAHAALVAIPPVEGARLVTQYPLGLSIVEQWELPESEEQ